MPSTTPPKRAKWLPVRKVQGRRRNRAEDQRFYNSTKWRRKSKNNLYLNPDCAECARKGLVTAAQMTDHIIPRHQGGAEYDDDNLQSLCNSCHAIKSGREAHQKE